jgi:parallel beta-helix repeat protein
MLVIKRKAFAMSILTLLLTSMFVATFNVHRAKAIGPIYIRADGSIDPSDAPIITYDYLTYTLTDNITSSADGIVVERDNIIIDGAGYTLQGTWAYYSYSKGIDLTGRTNVTVKNVRITVFYYGIYLSSSTNNIVRENDMANNGWYDHGCGIYLISSPNNTILENDIMHDWVNGTASGIKLDHSSYNAICRNTITNSCYGIVLSSSSSNVLTNNTMSSTIELNDTIYRLPLDFAVLGSSLPEYVNYVDSSNTVGGKPIYYWVNRRELTVPSDAGCVILVNCTDIRVQNLNLTGNFPSICLAYTTDCTINQNEVSMASAGIMLYFSSANVISKNKVSSHFFNTWISGICLVSSDNNILFGNNIKEAMTIGNSMGGMWLDSSSHNIIYENTITAYQRGIFLNLSTENTIYHNNFINSTQQAYSLNSVNVWDDGYPSGGNYWSDHVGADMFRGPYQNETGSDGIWDSPYTIDEHNRDNYPLVNPYTSHTTPAAVEWNRTYGTTNNDWAVSLLQTSDGGFAMAGPWNRSTGNILSVGIVKTDSNGNVQWTRTFEVDSFMSVGVFDRCALFETEERAFAFSSSINITGNIDIWLVKVDEDGQPIWNHTYGGTGNEMLISAVQTDDDGFLLVAWNYTVGGGTWLVKTDAYGNVEWEKSYGDWLGTCGVETIDGGLALTALVASTSNNTISIILLKMDAAGNILWNQTLSHSQTPIAMATMPRLLQVADRGFVLVGTQMENNDSSILLVRTDEDGNIEWNKTYDNDGWEGVFSITEIYEGYAILGATNSSTARGLIDVWLVRTDLTGNVLWDSTYGGEGMDIGFSIITTRDGGLAFAGGTNSSGAGEMDFWLVKLSPEVQDDEPPIVKNVRHEPLYPMENETIYFCADVTDNVAVASVQLNYTLNGGATWLLQDMTLTEGNTYSTSMGPFNQFKLIGFYIIAYDTSGNKAYGSEIVPPLPEPPKVAPIVVSNEPPNPLPNGDDVSYNVTDGGTEIYVNVTELGIYDPGLWYNISYSIDGGITWISQQMTQVSDYVWKYWVNATTNILFKIVAGDGTVESRVYWIIVGPWKYPIYLYFSNDEKYFPVAGLDFDGDSTVENNWISYETTPDYWKLVFEENDLDNDGTRDLWSYAYMNPKSMNDGCLVIEYWIYYAFNEYAVLRPIFRGDHEHDFESVYLWIDVASGTIKKIALNQHNWVNHYTFLSPPKRLNIAVEKGGHGMALLKDENDDGLPEDFDVFPGYDIWQPEGGGTFISGTWNDQSLVASLYPWVIYDPRIPVSKLHLFGDPSILTTGFSLEAISPLLPSIVDETPQYYDWVTDMLGYKYVLKTSYGAPLPLSEGKMLVFQVSAPWYRQEFQNPSKMWNKAPWIIYTAKVTIKTLLPFIKAGIFSYFKIATSMPWVEKPLVNILTGWIAGEIIDTLFDPIRGSVQDSQGKVLGYTDDKMVDEIPGSFVFLPRDMTNNMYDLYLIVTNSTNDYIYEAKGESTETYNMTISSTNIEGREINFNAVNIPTKPNSVHRYMIHWDALERKEDGVEVWVDQNGDGNFESKFWSDGELTASEFAEATADATPPSTVHDYDGVWHTTDFIINLNATDDPSGVAETFYRINNGPIQNVSAHGQPRITLESTNNTIEYWSVDNAGNEELPHKILTGIKLDKAYPTIETPSRTPDGDVQPDQSVKISVNLTDTTSQVKNATLYYSLNNGTTWELPIPMNYNTTTGLYEATILGQQAGTWVRFKIVAYDYAGNNATLDGTQPYCVYQVIPEFPPSLILPIFMIITLLAAIFYKRKHSPL